MIGFSEKSACSSFKKASIFAAILVSSSAVTTAEADSQWSAIPRQYLLSLDEKYVGESSCRKAIEDTHRDEERNPSTSTSASANLTSSHCKSAYSPCECYYQESLAPLR